MSCLTIQLFMPGNKILVEKSFDTGEVILNYAEGPDNGPPILFIHGLLGRWGDFTHYYPHFTENFHIYAIDTRGRGKSEKTPGKYHLRYVAKDTATFIERCIGEPTILLGHSEGGWIALWAANLKPENVTALVILDSPITIDDFIAQEKDWIQPTIPLLGRPVDEIIAIRSEADPSSASETIRHSAICFSQADSRYLDLWSQGGFEEYFEGYHAWDFLKAVRCSIMLVQADPEMEASLSSDDVKKAIDYNPEIKYFSVKGVGHNLGTNIGEKPIDIKPILSFLESIM
jgi:pimeloyl-ACP methyl ester carboxylesterase